VDQPKSDTMNNTKAAQCFLALTILLLGFVTTTFSTNLISGIVYDEITNKPIPLVEVFISGTTIGTVANSEGQFELDAPYLPCQLVFNHISYTPVVFTAIKGESINIKLSSVNLKIREVIIVEKDSRRRNLRLFYEYFIGLESADQYDVLNDSVIEFSRNDTSFHAFSYSPLIVKNNYLGYEIKIWISDFYLCKKESSFGRHQKLNSAKGIMVSKLTGYYFYKPINYKTEEKKLQIQHNRLDHYFGSTVIF